MFSIKQLQSGSYPRALLERKVTASPPEVEKIKGEESFVLQ
jgi:hypothetical protein